MSTTTTVVSRRPRCDDDVDEIVQPATKVMIPADEMNQPILTITTARDAATMTTEELMLAVRRPLIHNGKVLTMDPELDAKCRKRRCEYYKTRVKLPKRTERYGPFSFEVDDFGADAIAGYKRAVTDFQDPRLVYGPALQEHTVFAAVRSIARRLRLALERVVLIQTNGEDPIHTYVDIDTSTTAATSVEDAKAFVNSFLNFGEPYVTACRMATVREAVESLRKAIEKLWPMIDLLEKNNVMLKEFMVEFFDR